MLSQFKQLLLNKPGSQCLCSTQLLDKFLPSSPSWFEDQKRRGYKLESSTDSIEKLVVDLQRTIDRAGFWPEKSAANSRMCQSSTDYEFPPTPTKQALSHNFSNTVVQSPFGVRSSPSGEPSPSLSAVGYPQPKSTSKSSLFLNSGDNVSPL